MLLTGRDLFSLDKSPSWFGQNIPTHHTTLPELLRTKGYQTFFAGKWHQDRNSFKRAFTHADNIFFGGMTYEHFAAKFHHYESTRGKFKSFTADKHTSNMIADAAVDFLKRQSNTSKPFFATASFLAPHDPRTAPENYHDLYPPEKTDLPANFMPEHPFDNGEMKIRDEKLAPFPRTPEVVKKHISDYYAMITHLDAQIGRILNALEKTGRANNTLIIFAGDNGLALGRHGLLGKQSLYDHSVRVPLIFTGPGIPENQKTDALCYLHDLFPTVCRLINIPVPDSVRSKSLTPVIRNKTNAVRDSLYFAYKDIQRGLRKDQYKLIKYNVNDKQTTQLFDLNKDPWEMNNLADNPAYTERLKKISRLLKQYAKKVGDNVEWI